MLNSLKFHNIIHSSTLWMKLKIIIEISCVSLGRALFVRHARTDRELRNIQRDVRRNSLSLSRISRVITLSAVMQTYQWIVDSMIDQFTCEYTNKKKKSLAILHAFPQHWSLQQCQLSLSILCICNNSISSDCFFFAFFSHVLRL